MACWVSALTPWKTLLTGSVGLWLQRGAHLHLHHVLHRPQSLRQEDAYLVLPHCAYVRTESGEGVVQRDLFLSFRFASLPTFWLFLFLFAFDARDCSSSSPCIVFLSSLFGPLMPF